MTHKLRNATIQLPILDFWKKAQRFKISKNLSFQFLLKINFFGAKIQIPSLAILKIRLLSVIFKHCEKLHFLECFKFQNCSIFRVSYFPDAAKIIIMRSYANTRSVIILPLLKDLPLQVNYLPHFLVLYIEAEMWDQSDDIFGSVGSLLFPEIGYTSFLKNPKIGYFVIYRTSSRIRH